MDVGQYKPVSTTDGLMRVGESVSYLGQQNLPERQERPWVQLCGHLEKPKNAATLSR